MLGLTDFRLFGARTDGLSGEKSGKSGAGLGCQNASNCIIQIETRQEVHALLHIKIPFVSQFAQALQRIGNENRATERDEKICKKGEKEKIEISPRFSCAKFSHSVLQH